jgi:hypothetical protein
MANAKTEKQIRDQLKDEEQARRARFQEQCFLLYHRYQLRDSLKVVADRDIAVDTRQKMPTAAKNSGVEKILDYHHIVTIDAKDPTYLASQISAIDGAEIFFDLDANILSQLKPIVELYKIYPNKKTTSKGVEVPLRVPFLLGEGIKDSAAVDTTENGLSALDDLFRSHNTLGNVMPHNFRIKFAGKDIAWVNAIDQFSFSLSFSSFKLFNHEFKTTDDLGDLVKWRYTDLISTPPGQFSVASTAPRIGSVDSLPGGECSYDWNATEGGKKIDPPPNSNPKENPEYFEIQAVIKYDPEIDWDMADLGDVWTRYEPEDMEKLENFLRGSALVVRLQFKQHTIRYSMGDSGGTNTEFVLDLDYAAYLEGVLNSPDLNLLALNDADEKAMEVLETDLAYAKRLLAEVRSKDFTLNQAIAGNGTGANTENQIATAYVKLRHSFSQRIGWPGQWLIRMPATVDPNTGQIKGWKPFDQIVPTKAAIEKERGRAGDTDTARFPAAKNALAQDPKSSKDVPTGQTLGEHRLVIRKNNAARVFQELVNAYDNHIARKRRAFQHVRYRKYFQHLLGKGRIYKVEAEPQKVGMSSGVTKGDTIVADARAQGTPEEGSWSGLSAKSVIVCDPAEASVQNNLISEFEENADSIQKGAVKSFAGAQDMAQSFSDGRLKGFETKNNNRLIYFTTFGDILDVAIDIATRDKIDYDEATGGIGVYGTFGPGLFKRRMGVLLGPLIDETTALAETYKGAKTFNLAHVPVSLSLLMGWWIQNVSAKERTVYTLHQFIRDLIKNLVGKMLGESCIEGGGNRSEDVKIINFTSEMRPLNKDHNIPPFYPRGPRQGKTGDYPPQGNSSVLLEETETGGLFLKGISRNSGMPPLYPLPWGSRRVDKKKVAQNVAGQLTKVDPSKPLKDQFNYMFIYVHSYDPKNLDPALEMKNIRRGIYYLRLGKMTSVIKSCAFTRMEIPYLREMRIAGHTSPTGATMLRDTYDARITLFGNNIFKVGSHVFVDPTKDGAEKFDDWRRLGIGGFYLVTEVEQILLHDDVTQETNLKLRYVTAGNCSESGKGTKVTYSNYSTATPATYEDGNKKEHTYPQEGPTVDGNPDKRP